MAVRERPQLLRHVVLSAGLLKHPLDTSWFPQSEWSQRGQGGSHDIFSKPTSEVTLHHFHNILWVLRLSPIQCARELLNNRWMYQNRGTLKKKKKKIQPPCCAAWMGCLVSDGSCARQGLAAALGLVRRTGPGPWMRGGQGPGLAWVTLSVGPQKALTRPPVGIPTPGNGSIDWPECVRGCHGVFNISGDSFRGKGKVS